MQKRVRLSDARFIKRLEGLYPRPSNWPKTTGIDPTLRKVFPALQAAVATFRPYVSDDQKAAFDEAWRDYRCSTKRDVDTQDYTHYLNIGSESINALGGGGVTRNKQDGKLNFKRNVDRQVCARRTAGGETGSPRKKHH